MTQVAQEQPGAGGGRFKVWDEEGEGAEQESLRQADRDAAGRFSRLTPGQRKALLRARRRQRFLGLSR